MTSAFRMKATGTATVGEDAGPPDARPRHKPPRRIAPGSPQQEAFWSALLEGSGHVLLEARAGTGKSSSCREGMHRLLESRGPLDVRYCCFNKKIAEEFAEGCPPGVDVGTMHSMGLKALKRAFGGQIDANKSYTVLDSIAGCDSLPRYLRKSVAQVVSLAKNTLDGDLGAIVDWYDVETYRRRGEVVDLAAEVLALSREQTSIFDFDDMLWLPVAHGLEFPAADFLFVDECQDLNPVQHALVPLLNRGGRTILVGDPFQSIYAFRGADSESIPKLRDRLDAATMPLTVTWRCPRSHVEIARRLVPDLEAAPSASEGVLDAGGLELLDQAAPGDLVLCRSNAPLIAGCLGLIRERRRAIVRGRALGEQLTGIVRKVDARTVDDLLTGIARWKAGELARLGRKDGTEHLVEAAIDKATCLEAIAETCGSPAEVPGVIASLFADDDAAGRVTFSTVHRAKGSEAANVFYVQVPYGEKRDKHRPPPAWELDQRRNLRYVALTRSMRRLCLIDPGRREFEGPGRAPTSSVPPARETPPPVPATALSDLDRKRIDYFGLNVKGA